ncbi:MAG: hypothetical protein JJE52_18085 [Acidimicrobiia bacterium]|nr:hypothetical protein [Acidimicrobiia bacterium]
MIEFGDDGITRIVDGRRQLVWDEPVEQAFDDLAGGVVFQQRSVVTEHPDGRVDLERGAIGLCLVHPRRPRRSRRVHRPIHDVVHEVVGVR